MTKALVIGNWKMNLDYVEAIHLVQQLGVLMRGQVLDNVEAAVAPPFVDIRSVSSVIEADRLPLAVAGQHAHHLESGAFTGEVSVSMLKRLGVRYVLVGHSERRVHFAMSDDVVRDTAVAVANAGLTAVICCGETMEQRSEGLTNHVIHEQIVAALSKIDPKNHERIVVAYEPLWAIGSGVTATDGDITAVVQVIRDSFPSSWNAKPRVLYGGSVNADNCGALVEGSPIDGFLVGGASLKAEEFVAIIAKTHACYRK